MTWAGGSAGGADHILAALFTKAAGSDPAKVNYIAFSGGGEALAAMLGGRVTAGVSGYGEFESQIKAGKLRALGDLLRQAPGRRRRADPEGAGHGCRGRELARHHGRPRHHAGPEEGADRTVDKLVKSKEWTEILKQRGWEDFYLAGEPSTAFLKEEQARVGDILKSIGLVKS